MERLSDSISVGGGDFMYTPVEGWGSGPTGHALGLVSAVATDSADRVYIFNRTPETAVLIFDREGNFLDSWGRISSSPRTRSGSMPMISFI